MPISHLHPPLNLCHLQSWWVYRSGDFSEPRPDRPNGTPTGWERGIHPPPKFVCGVDRPPPSTWNFAAQPPVSSLYVVESIETTLVGNMAVIYDVELCNHFLSNAFA